MLSFSLWAVVIVLSILTLQAMTPYWLMGALILQTMMVSFYLSLLKGNVWYSYILFLVFLGGVLVLFSYASSLVSEELLESVPYFVLSGMMFIILLANCSMLWLEELYGFTGEMIMMEWKWGESVSKLFSTYTTLMYSFTIGYLLLALISVVNMSKSKLGPLRRLM